MISLIRNENSYFPFSLLSSWYIKRGIRSTISFEWINLFNMEIRLVFLLRIGFWNVNLMNKAKLCVVQEQPTSLPWNKIHLHNCALVVGRNFCIAIYVRNNCLHFTFYIKNKIIITESGTHRNRKKKQKPLIIVILETVTIISTDFLQELDVRYMLHV